jgi:soluble lytic murein transglycosylase
LFRVFRLLFIVLGISAALTTIASTTIARAEDNADSTALAAIAAARAGDWPQAYAKASQASDGVLLKIVRWLDFTRPTPGGRFAELAAFIDQNPDWPLQKKLQRRAEEALIGENDEVAADWLKRHPPIGGVGKAREAQILLNRGNTEAGTAALRAAWIDGDFNVADERPFLVRHYGMLRPEDHEKRLDRLIWDGLTDAARHMLPLVPADYRLAAEARLALAADAANGEALLAKVPAQWRSDPGVAFEEARWRRKKNNYEAAAQLLLAHGDSPARPAAWWGERQLVARQLLATGNADTAYKLLQQHGLSDGNAYSEAEFLTGYIALRYSKDPALALDHFTRILARVTTPYGKARAAYWSGRAAEAAGNSALAAKWYTTGAENMATFYGQLAAHQLGKDAPPRPVPEPQPSAAEQKHFDAEELVRAAKLLFAAGDRDHARNFIMQMADAAKTPIDFAMLASLAEAQGRIDLAIAVAKRSIEAGTPLMVHGYPITPLPSGGTAERSLLFAIVRQESGFATDAMSRVGARGLMQLMPATAAGLAGKLQLPYSLDRLTSDGVYNLTLGRSYIETMIDEFGGSYPLAIAAYNAGPGRIRQWLHEFGDPRGRDISMVDWIEMIPFNETRLYVHRVLENLQIYRGQDTNNVAAFSLASDLAR